jgi:hypothetical protein
MCYNLVWEKLDITTLRVLKYLLFVLKMLSLSKGIKGRVCERGMRPK